MSFSLMTIKYNHQHIFFGYLHIWRFPKSQGYPQIIQVMDDHFSIFFSIETHGDWGIPPFKKPPYVYGFRITGQVFFWHMCMAIFPCPSLINFVNAPRYVFLSGCFCFISLFHVVCPLVNEHSYCMEHHHFNG